MRVNCKCSHEGEDVGQISHSPSLVFFDDAHDTFRLFHCEHLKAGSRMGQPCRQETQVALGSIYPSFSRHSWRRSLAYSLPSPVPWTHWVPLLGGREMRKPLLMASQAEVALSLHPWHTVLWLWSFPSFKSSYRGHTVDSRVMKPAR